MPHLTIPPEEAYTDVELDWIDSEPPGLFPGDQSSYWGQVRHLFASYLQTNFADRFATWYLALNPSTANATEIKFYERELGIPVDTTKTLDARRTAVISRMKKGIFTRLQRATIVEDFLRARIGASVSIVPEGVELTTAGVPLFADIVDVSASYRIVETIGSFSYQVRILNTTGVDTDALARELTRSTPAGIAFTILLTPTP